MTFNDQIENLKDVVNSEQVRQQDRINEYCLLVVMIWELVATSKSKTSKDVKLLIERFNKL